MLTLLVEDNHQLALNIIDFLQLHGVECDYAATLAQAEQCLKHTVFDAVILDLNLPDGDGIRWCEHQQLNVPTLMLTARGELEDRLQGFAAGADDYLVKPFAMAELVARLKAVKRRQPEASELVIGDLRLDLTRQQAYRANKPLKLTHSCWQLLLLLAQRSPALVPRQELERKIWPEGAPDSDAFRSHMYRLRQEVDKPFPKPLLRTRRGVGVALIDPSTHHDPL